MTFESWLQSEICLDCYKKQSQKLQIFKDGVMQYGDIYCR